MRLRRVRPAVTGTVVAALAAVVATGAVVAAARDGSGDGAVAAAAVAAPRAAAPAERGAKAPVTRSAHRVENGWIATPVATMWTGPRKPRAVDRAATAPRADVHRWLRHLDLGQRLDLGDRVMTQALLGDRVRILARWPRWSKVQLVDQTGSAFPHGIVGWVPTAQVTTTPPATRTHELATVVARHASLRLLDRPGILSVSYGTRLPVVAHGRHRVVLAVPGAGRAAIAAALVRVGAHHPTGADVLRAAERFMHAPYLWGGLSTWGIDCSGLTYLIYRRMGITLPRDAADQARVGGSVPRSRLRVGDLVFFGSGGWRSIHHVGIYAGHGLLLHAPHTGDHVRFTRLSKFPDYWGARRYLRH